MAGKDFYTCSVFGYGKYGQLGHECATFNRAPSLISLPEPIFSVSGGEGHSGVLTEAFKLYTFGKNTYGQLGLGHSSPVGCPSLVTQLQNKKIETVVCGSEHTLAITNDGEVYTWGLNLKGQLGLGDTSNRFSPALVENISSKHSSYQGHSLEKGERVVQAACGGLHTLVLTDRNKVLACGHGNNHALGLGAQDNVTRFVPIKQLEGLGKIDKIKAGLACSAAVIQGNLYVWGKLKSVYTTPSRVLFDNTSHHVRSKSNSPRTGTIEDIACGDNFCVCVSKGQVWVIGEGLGYSSKEPVKIETIKDIKYISCGLKHAVGISNDYSLLAWGNNDYGQCGELTTSTYPTILPSYSKAKTFKVACGSYHTLLLSEYPPVVIKCKNPNPCPHETELKLLKSQLEEIKFSKNHKKTNSYLEKALKQEKYLTPSFEVNYNEIIIYPEPIGRGGYSTVFKGKWRGTTIAIKKMKIEGSNDRYDEFMQECQTMMSVRHPNIVLFMGACTVSPKLCIILEYCGNGSLWDILRNHSTPLPWYLRCKIALDIARGVNYLHSFPVPVLHRDLKSLNILLDDAMNAKLSDFGWARFKAETMTNKIGTYQWMAPEVIKTHEYSEKADVYSFAIILWELATRKPPFKELNGLQVSQEVANNDLRPPIPKRCPDPFLKLMQKCWAKEPNTRPSFENIIEELESFLKFLERSAVN
jgi:Protein tyrosine and serine/threonine kinase/Regulator of chromosome condensation (RCC1) repeat